MLIVKDLYFYFMKRNIILIINDMSFEMITKKIKDI